LWSREISILDHVGRTFLHPTQLSNYLLPVLHSIAIMKGKQDSEESVVHRSIALKTVNHRLSRCGVGSDDGYVSDSNIAAVTLLAGHEVFIFTRFPDARNLTDSWSSFFLDHPRFSTCT
jgi:hypothetical protein